jgi:hypothetical protein
VALSTPYILYDVSVRGVFLPIIIPIFVVVEGEIHLEGTGADDLQFRAALATGDIGSLTWVIGAYYRITIGAIRPRHFLPP